MRRIRREPRLTPPWPPGLESIKKAFLGPRRYRQTPPPGTEWTLYDDALPVALTIQSFLKGESAYALRVPGIEIKGELDLGLRPDPAEARSFLQYLIEGRPYDPAELARCEGWQVRIDAIVDKVLFGHTSRMVHAGPRTMRLSPAWQSAFKTLHRL